MRQINHVLMKRNTDSKPWPEILRFRQKDLEMTLTTDNEEVSSIQEAINRNIALRKILINNAIDVYYGKDREQSADLVQSIILELGWFEMVKTWRDEFVENVAQHILKEYGGVDSEARAIAEGIFIIVGHPGN